MSTDAPSPHAPLAVDAALLPDDAAVLKELVAQLMQEIQKRDGRVERLEHQLTLLLRRMYGIKSEKLDPRQALLFGEAVAEEVALAEPASVAVADEAKERTPGRRAGAHGRRRLPDTLQRREVLHDLTPAEKESLGGEENIELIGREVTEQLEWEPSTLFVIQHVQLTYARKLLAAGVDPSEHRKATRAASEERAGNSFEVVAREWLGKRNWVDSYKVKVLAWFTNDVFPWIGGRPVASLTAPDFI